MSSSEGTGPGAACEPNAREMTVSLVQINEHFICTICKGYLRNAHTIKECLHTFCNGCIRWHFMQHVKNTNCPICNAYLGTKPWNQLMPDPVIEDLARKFLPDFRLKEDKEEREFYTKLGIKRKLAAPRESTGAGASHRAIPRHGPKIQFNLLPRRSVDEPLFQQLRALDVPEMSTQADLKIMYIRKYIVKKLKLDAADAVEILCRGEPVGAEHSLEFVRRTLWQDKAKMVLEYRRRRTV